MAPSSETTESETEKTKQPTNVASPPKKNEPVQEKNVSSDEEKSYQYYPERRGGKYDAGWFQRIFLGEGRDSIDRIRCERNVYKCTERSPIVKLMMSALKSAGCEVDIRRHICCENCTKDVTGGYDPQLNQVVICQNAARSEGMVQGALAHELLHMFDQCRAKLDLRNVDHLACTEIRAANLMHCSFMSAMMQGSASPFRIAQQHAECVKAKALASILAVRNITSEEAMKAINRVFKRCYNDLEPVGRRIRRNSLDMEKAYRERFHYGYYD